MTGRLACVEPGVGDHDREKVGHAAGELAFRHEHRLVRIVEAGAAEAGNVGRGEHAYDAGHRSRCFRVNLHDPRTWVLGQHHGAVQHPGYAEVVHERLLAERLLQSAEA